jgi:putative hydrolase of the HAD superfamily
MYKNILFDLGNVFITVKPERALAKLSEYMPLQTAEISKKEPESFLKEICDDQALFETGKITMPQFFSKLKENFDLKMSVEQFEGVWCSMFSRKKDVIQFATELSRKYKIFILSNTNETHINHLIDALPIFDFVSGTAFSHEIGFLKPQHDFYFKALKKLNINAEESIFIDDLEDNVKAAAEAGITSFKFENLVKLKEEMKEILNNYLNYD